jgi:DNA-binding MarR family transcriptional regulator
MATPWPGRTGDFPGGNRISASGTIDECHPFRSDLRSLDADVRQAGGVENRPLSDDEHLVWRSLMQLTCTLRPALDEDLQRSCGLSATEYSVLMHVSEAPDRQLRMSELAGRCGLSPSRISRVIDQMARLGLVERRPGAGDGRNTYAALTRTGLSTLRRAWPHHIRSVRQRAFDHLTAEEARILGPVLQRLAEVNDPVRSPTSGNATTGESGS